MEAARLDLADHTGFEPFQAFKRIDRLSTGNIDDADIVTFCADNGVHCTHHDAANVIAQYDENSNGRLSFTEFNQMCLPATNESLRILATSRDYSTLKPRTAVLPASLEVALARVFGAEIDFQRRTGGLKADLNARYDFTVRSAFDAMDTLAPSNRIDRIEIRNYVDAHVRWLSEAELDAIIRRCDTDGDESLSYLEFSETVRGILPSPASPIRVTHYTTIGDASPLRRSISPYRSPSSKRLKYVLILV